MKIRIVSVGKLKQGPLHELFESYLKRCSWQIAIREIEAGPWEEKHLLSHISQKDFVILLDENGHNYSSVELSQLIEKLQTSGQSSNIAFIIGGPDGVGENLKQRANVTIAFGAQTWPHLLVRVMLIEQIYRCETILKGHPYHKA